MTKFRMIGAACLVAALAAASPAMARGGHGGGGHTGGAHLADGGFHGGGFRHRGFRSGIAADVIGGAALVAGAYYYGGYTPYGDSYAYDHDGGYVPQPYYGNNDSVCQPGTIFLAEDGRRHLCQ